MAEWRASISVVGRTVSEERHISPSWRKWTLGRKRKGHTSADLVAEMGLVRVPV